MQAVPATPLTSVPGTYWQWKGHSIYYVKSGSPQPGKPPLVLIHGFGASTDHWRKNIAELQQDFEVWAIDLLGFGRSAKPNIEYTGYLWRDQVADFITEVIGSPAVLAGNSLGGYTSLCVGAQRPEAACGVILLNSAGPFTENLLQSQPKPMQQVVSNFLRWVLLQPLPNFLLFQYVRQPSVIRKTLKKVYLDQSAVTDQLVEDIYRPSCDRGATDVFASVFKTPQGDKVDFLLSLLKCPLLLIWGESDPWMNCRERGTKFKFHYPSLTEYYLKAGHCPHDEVPEQVNNLIRSWVYSEIVKLDD